MKYAIGIISAIGANVLIRGLKLEINEFMIGWICCNVYVLSKELYDEYYLS
jgi:uncharacterized membrane protein (DUF485 family)